MPYRLLIKFVMILLDPIIRYFKKNDTKDYKTFFQEYNESFLLSIDTIISGMYSKANG